MQAIALKVRQGSAIGQDLVFAGGQIILAGDVTRNVQVATAALRIARKCGRERKRGSGRARPGSRGTAAGDVHAAIYH